DGRRKRPRRAFPACRPTCSRRNMRCRERSRPSCSPAPFARCRRRSTRRRRNRPPISFNGPGSRRAFLSALPKSTNRTRGNIMIYELRTYTVKPGTLGDMVKAASTVSRDIRGSNFGKLEGYWFTEIGPLNQVLHMWSYSDLNERARLRAELAKNARWTSEYIPLLRPILLHQQVRLMNAIKPPVAPASTGNVYELRNYRAKPLGAVRQWIEAFTAALPAREKYSKMVGLWHTET